MEEINQATPAPVTICGGHSEARKLDDRDQALFEEFRDIIEQKVRSQFEIPENFKLEPTSVRTQVVAGMNYTFHVRLPNDQSARVRIFRPIKGHALEAGDRASFVTVSIAPTQD